MASRRSAGLGAEFQEPRAKKVSYLASFRRHDGNRAKAAAECELSPATPRGWYYKDAAFASALDAIVDGIMKDIRENPHRPDGTWRCPPYIASTPHGPDGNTKKTPENIQIVLTYLGAGSSISMAARAIGIARRTLISWKDDDPEFAIQYAEAMQAGLDRLEDEAYRRAHDGVEKPVYQGGELVGHVQEYSDKLLCFLLEAKRQDIFRRNASIQLPPGAGANGGTLTVQWKDADPAASSEQGEQT